MGKLVFKNLIIVPFYRKSTLLLQICITLIIRNQNQIPFLLLLLFEPLNDKNASLFLKEQFLTFFFISQRIRARSQEPLSNPIL